MIVREKQISQDGTVKFLSELADGNLIETVLMRHDYGNSVCVTSQVGCNMGCCFCASGLLKKVRDLTAEEMLVQVAAAQDVTHVVVMGTGEPFDNYDEVLRFCDMVSDERKFHAAAVAPRHITVSTCGLVPEILEFAQTAKRYNLAISLHAPDDEIRNRLMPVNKRYPVADVIRAAKDYCKATGRRVTFEYLLLKGINDSPDCAEKLAALLSGGDLKAYVNLIPWNDIGEFPAIQMPDGNSSENAGLCDTTSISCITGTGKEQALAFYDILMKNGIKATLRKERGTDISAACGQLRAQALIPR